MTPIGATPYVETYSCCLYGDFFYTVDATSHKNAAEMAVEKYQQQTANWDDSRYIVEVVNKHDDRRKITVNVYTERRYEAE